MVQLFTSLRESKGKEQIDRLVDTCIGKFRFVLVESLNCGSIAMLALALIGCASGQVANGPRPSGLKGDLVAINVDKPVLLRLKAQPQTSETVDYFHISSSRAFEGRELRNEKTETLGFTANAETVKVDADKFTQTITVSKKDGTIGLHDFAMPEPGEKLEVVADNKGKILKAGDWPTNSIFYVSPISLPENPVEVGETWVMQASWLSLQDMVPYELEMVSILRGFVKCGADICADIEINGNVGMQGQLKQALVFRSEWRGRMLFAIDAGTVVWSRTNSEETFAYDRVHRTIGSCLEAALRQPSLRSLIPAEAKLACEGFTPPLASESTKERAL
jgi:hypothetical protein